MQLNNPAPALKDPPSTSTNLVMVNVPVPEITPINEEGASGSP